MGQLWYTDQSCFGLIDTEFKLKTGITWTHKKYSGVTISKNSKENGDTTIIKRVLDIF